MDGDARQTAETTVDATHNAVDGGTEFLVLGDFRAGWHRDLDEEDFIAPSGVLFQDFLDRQQFLGDALDHIQAVHAEHNLRYKTYQRRKKLDDEVRVGDIEI